jgi:trk system potassium uptake protein
MRLFRTELNPLQTFVASFALLAVIGTALLMLPIAAAGRLVPWHDALFTATSALCVTGLAVQDTGTVFTGFGQVVILLLIQVGGVGLMTFSTLVLLILGRRASMNDSYIVEYSYSEQTLRISRLLMIVFLFTLAAETAGALLLYPVFRDQYPAGYAAWSAVFHSVSAFCNAGFSLYSDSLCGYRTSWTVNLVITGLIIIGGIGFPVISEIVRHVQARRMRRSSRLNLHTMIVVGMTATLLLVGTLGFYLTEPQCRDAESNGLLTAFFQSVTTRTAGFNTIDFSRTTGGTNLLTCGLMFIGGSPGSTAGGLKTTTTLVILLLAFTHLRGRSRTELVSRLIPESNAVKAVTLAVLFVALIFTGTMLLLLFGGGPAGGLSFESAMFETISALATVGLSLGITAQLSVAGKLILTALMLLVRLGPLVVARLFIRPEGQGKYRFPEENVMVG